MDMTDGHTSNIFKHSHILVLGVVGVGNHRMLPRSLVCRVVNLGRFPFSLVVRVINSRRLPVSIGLVIPVIGLLGLGIGNFSGLVVPVGGLLGLGVIDLLEVNPVLKKEKNKIYRRR